MHLDLRYTGQEFTLPVPVTLAQLKKGDRRAIRKAFDALYEQRYAHHSPDEPVEMVNVRLALIGKRPKLTFPKKRAGKRPTPRRRPVYLGNADKPVSCPVYARDTLPAGARIAGPALIEEHGTTTVLYAGDSCRVAPSGELIIALGGSR
jgi:N-methylhydantoinase A